MRRLVSKTALIAYFAFAVLAIAGTTAYFFITEQQGQRRAQERQADEARRERIAAEKALKDAADERRNAEIEKEAAQAAKDARASVVRELRTDIEKSIRAKYRENGSTPTEVGCSLTGSRTYRCIVEYIDEFGDSSDLVEAKISADGSYVWSEINP